MTRNFNASYNVRRAINNAIDMDNECGYCGTACREEDDFCSTRCERAAQGGLQRVATRQEWDG